MIFLIYNYITFDLLSSQINAKLDIKKNKIVNLYDKVYHIYSDHNTFDKSVLRIISMTLRAFSLCNKSFESLKSVGLMLLFM